ncbi:MAG: acetate--CoA ligase [Candidatus Schekmanbacteria bacterium]|nr:acetate--CoA ligase [Candidatus Schekmanbacteria bacterium]
MGNETIQSTLTENRLFPPPAAFSRGASIDDGQRLEHLCSEASRDPASFWARHAQEEITWHKPFSSALDRSRAPHFAWFADGELNISFNCLDRHLARRGDKTAIIWHGDRGETRHLSYREIHGEVCRLANAMRARGIQPGDRVVIYLPMVPEAVIAMQACARIGAIHSVVFGGFSAEALRDRIEDAQARLLITADGGHRAGKIIELKRAADRALDHGCASIESVIVLARTGHGVPMKEGRDEWWHAVVAAMPAHCEPTWVGAEHPLFLLYTSGSTGKPKGIQHSTGGYLLGAIVTCKWVFDLTESDVFWCTADVGWVTGHSYVAYGPLALGATEVMYEGTPTYPHGGRFWELCERHGVTIFYTAPTAIRALMKLGDDIPTQFDLSKIRLLGTVGEPINPEAWMWYYIHVGKERCPIVDTWWQTETGSIMVSPVPGVTALKPGSCARPLPGIVAGIVDEAGNDIAAPDQGGYLVIKEPWPSMVRTIWGDDQRFKDTYFRRFGDSLYVTGDSARRDADGYYWIMGRVDDVLNVAGHRLGTMEIESALVAHARVAEAAVVGRPDELTGEAVVAFVVLKGQRPAGDERVALAKELRGWVTEQIGAIARPADIRFSDNLPKTRSGKIMRRLIRAIARGEEITQDTSTLENEAILDQLREKQ